MCYVPRSWFYTQFICKSILVSKLCMVIDFVLSSRSRLQFLRFPWGPVHTYPYSFENATSFLRFPIKFLITCSIFASFSPVHTYTMNRFENDNLPDCGCLTHNCPLLWVREIINSRHLWISLVWVYIVVRSLKSQKQFKMSKSGQKQSQTKGRSNLLPLDTGSESNLIMFCRLLE